MAHTPGPWKAVIHKDIIAHVEGGNALIAQVKQHYVGPLKNQWQDNTRLIISAPDLLAALEAVEWFGGLGDVCPLCRQRKSGGHADGCQLAAALTKAKGL